MNSIQTSKYFKFISASLAFLLWGGWAFYVNSKSGYEHGILSGITQGTCSFILTLIMTNAITHQYGKISNSTFKIVAPPIITVGITGTLLTGIHIAIGTSAVFYTVLPALIVALLFCFFIIYKLHVAELRYIKEQEDNG